jgi:hypothetical protein
MKLVDYKSHIGHCVLEEHQVTQSKVSQKLNGFVFFLISNVFQEFVVVHVTDEKTGLVRSEGSTCLNLMQTFSFHGLKGCFLVEDARLVVQNLQALILVSLEFIQHINLINKLLSLDFFLIVLLKHLHVSQEL